jgi:oxygen-independent coproporphyrinogen-3 oxidase
LKPSLQELIDSGNLLQGYTYAYPHKTAYRPLDPPVPLAEVWRAEDKTALFLYAHVPFCEMRCGFCNLFTTTNPAVGLVDRYLQALERQAETVAAALGSAARFARLALGGGTPTFLSATELGRLLEILARRFAGIAGSIPKAIEASPATVDEEKVSLLRSAGVTRVSLGVQSFIESEARALGRSQRTADARRTLALLTSAGFACVNIDLIYGIAGQTTKSWQRSLEEALEFAPQELYLYPLYVRPLTGLDRVGRPSANDAGALGTARPASAAKAGRATKVGRAVPSAPLYRAGRDFLLQRGYRQISMRLFRHATYRPPEGPVYCCQEDGMVGLGAGARSYTSALHYSTEYAVRGDNIRAILHDYVLRSPQQFAAADYGCRLDAGEQRRRYLLKSLLRSDGLELEKYRARFQTELWTDFPELEQLDDLATCDGTHLKLNARGLELSDVIGPWLCSSRMREKMEQFALR